MNGSATWKRYTDWIQCKKNYHNFSVSGHLVMIWLRLNHALVYQFYELSRNSDSRDFKCFLLLLEINTFRGTFHATIISFLSTLFGLFAKAANETDIDWYVDNHIFVWQQMSPRISQPLCNVFIAHCGNNLCTHYNANGIFWSVCFGRGSWSIQNTI